MISSIFSSSITGAAMLLFKVIIITMVSATQQETTDAGTAPRISPVKPVLKALPGKIAVMPCEVTGDPSPSIAWERDGKPIQLFGSRFSVNKGNNALRVFRMVIEDSGNYTCIAKNKHGLDSITITLLVLVKPKAMITAPRDFTFMEKTNQELVCRSRGLPRPSFEWLTNDHNRIKLSPTVILDNTVTHERLYARERQLDEEVYESVLVFEPITFEDLGSFSCVATNEVGSTRASVTLDVRFSPKVLSQHSTPGHVTWWEGHKTNLTCVVTGNELPEVTWSLNGRPFDCKESDDLVHGAVVTSTCMVTSSRHGGPGNYTCSANNSMGRIVAHEFHVKEIFTPPPVDFRPISVKLYEVLLSVKVPFREDTPPSSYVLATYKLATYKVDDVDMGMEYETMADVNERGEATVKLLGVLEDREYVVSVRARNMAGLGPKSTMVISTEIPSSTPSRPPSSTQPSTYQLTDELSESSYQNQESNKDDNNNNNNDSNDDIINNLNNNADNDMDSDDETNNEMDDNGEEREDEEYEDFETATAYRVLGRDNGAPALHMACWRYCCLVICVYLLILLGIQS